MKFKLTNVYSYLFRLLSCGNARKIILIGGKNKNTDFNIRLKEAGIFRDVIDSMVFGFLTSKKDEKLCLDIGANLGEFGKRLEKYYGKEVIYIEANPVVFTRLQDNIKNKERAINVAISDVNGVQNFSYIPEHTGAGKIGKATSSKEISISIYSSTLDDLLLKELKVESLSGIKIDVEGHEMKVLEGAKLVIRKFNPLLCIELSDSKDFDKLKRMLPHYRFYYVSIPGLDFTTSFFLRAWRVVVTLIRRKGYFLEYHDNKKGFVSGLICIPEVHQVHLLGELNSFFKNEIDFLS